MAQGMMLRPDEVLHDARYLCIEPEKREQIIRHLINLWDAARNEPGVSERRKALESIRAFSVAVLDRVRQIEVAMMQGNHTQEYMDSQQTQDKHSRTLSQSQGGSVKEFAERQPEVHHQPRSLPVHQTAQSTDPQPYDANMGSSRQGLPSFQSQVAQPSHLSQSDSLSVRQSPILPRATETTKPHASTPLLANISHYIPQVWHCLRLTSQAIGPTTEDALQERQRARQWLISFKMSLSSEGRSYVSQVVKWMHAEQNAGRDPLVSLARPTQ